MSRKRLFENYPGLPQPAMIVFAPDADDIVNDDLRDLFIKWQAIGGPNAGPAIADEHETRALYRHLMLLEVCRDNPLEVDFVYRIYGAGVAERYGTDMTGRRTSEFPSGVARLFLRLYERAVDSAIPIYSEHAPPKHVNVKLWERLILPLGGDPVNYVLTANLPHGQRRPETTPRSRPRPASVAHAV